MRRELATKTTKELLVKHGLNNWNVVLTLDDKIKFLGLCDYATQTIILNAHGVDIQPDEEVMDTILHEVAHALCPNQGHNNTWAHKAMELGARTTPCNAFSIPAHVIDAIRSGQIVEMEMETIKIPKYKVTMLKDKCPECGKVAVEKFNIESKDRDGNIVRLITLECFHIIKKVIPKGTAFDKMISNDWKDEVKSCIHKWPTKEEAKDKDLMKNQCMKCGEFKLLSFQIPGAQFGESALATQKGVGIFDDMGLGKTVQALAIIKFHKEYTPTLYVVKSKLKFQWFKAIITWIGPTHLAQIISTGRDYVMPGLKSYIIPYDLLRRFPAEKLQKIGFKLVVLDECQQIKNPDSTRTKEVRALLQDESVRVIALSGTPWKNRGSEFFPVLNMISPSKFHSYQAYLDRWVDYYIVDEEKKKKKMGGIKNIDKFREYTADIVIRREFEEVMDEFPATPRTKLNVQLDELAQSTYDDEVSEFAKWYNQFVLEGTESSINSIELLGRMAKMRHIVGLAKIPATVGFVEEFIEDTSRKLTIFVHHKDVGELLKAECEKICKPLNIPVYFLPSEVTDEESYAIQELFNKAPRAILVASTLANGEGTNLQTCSDCVMHERQWNPQNEDQASPGRFRRIGQKATVISTTFTEAEGTIDEHIDSIVESKRMAFHKVMNKSEAPVWDESDFAKELANKIMAKHKAKNKGKDKPKVSLTQMVSM